MGAIETHPEFFAVVAPGFEMLAAKELEAWCPELEIEIAHGGLLFRAPLMSGCELNRVLKIPNRILLRLTSFTCRDFPKLFKKTSVFPWEQWIPNGAEAHFHATAHASRVSIKKRIEETCLEGFARRTKNRVLKPTRALDVYVRLDEDICTISADTSGEILHKRGIRTLTSEAPIRETIAAGLLFWMITTNEDENAGARLLATAPKPVTLVDPMMGSGTFFLEAVQLRKEGAGRDFAFEQFPRYQREKEGGGSTNLRSPTNLPKFKNPFVKFAGLDVSAKSVATTTGNLKALVGDHEIEALQGDIFKAEPLLGSESRWLIANPPYGERLKIEGSLKDYYEALFAACEKFARPERVCFVLPETVNPTKLSIPRTWKLIKSFRFQNGGLPVVAVQFIRVVQKANAALTPPD